MKRSALPLVPGVYGLVNLAYAEPSACVTKLSRPVTAFVVGQDTTDSDTEPCIVGHSSLERKAAAEDRTHPAEPQRKAIRECSSMAHVQELPSDSRSTAPPSARDAMPNNPILASFSRCS